MHVVTFVVSGSSREDSCDATPSYGCNSQETRKVSIGRGLSQPACYPWKILRTSFEHGTRGKGPAGLSEAFCGG